MKSQGPIIISNSFENIRIMLEKKNCEIETEKNLKKILLDENLSPITIFENIRIMLEEKKLQTNRNESEKKKFRKAKVQ